MPDERANLRHNGRLETPQRKQTIGSAIAGNARLFLEKSILEVRRQSLYCLVS